jgi:hypothetical protein
MTYRGRVKNGTILLDEPVVIPDGTAVEVVVPAVEEGSGDQQPRTLFEQLQSVIGKAQGLPSDLAENHDHYLHGLPKK